MNIITIDPSLSCTAVCVNGKFYVYASNPTAKTKTDKLQKWFQAMEQYVDYKFYDVTDKKLPYSRRELAKLNLYNEVTDQIINDIALNIDHESEDNIVCIEGYSYSSTSNTLIDLVTFSTLLRSKIMLDIEYKGIVLSPPSLKLKACMLTYPDERFNEKGKKLPFSNNDGVSGGRFKKHDMMKALLENDNLCSDWYVNVLREFEEELMDKKDIPKPIEDINDAKLMYEIIYALAQKNDYNLQLIEETLLA